MTHSNACMYLCGFGRDVAHLRIIEQRKKRKRKGDEEQHKDHEEFRECIENACKHHHVNTKLWKLSDK